MKIVSDTKQNLLDVANDLIWASNYGSVSVDHICAAADVNKGSFYHFFKSKAELAAGAIEDHWRQNQAKLDGIFSPQRPPLERIAAFCDAIYAYQKEKMIKVGRVCGSPYGSIGSEKSEEEIIRQKCVELFARIMKYLEATLRDAQREHLIASDDVTVLASQILALNEGILLQAKVRNDLEVVRQLKPAVFRLIGVKTPAIRK